MRKKILLVANSTWNIYNFRLSLIRHLKAEGYRVVVVAPVDEYIDYLHQTGVTRHVPLHHLRPQSRNPAHDLLLTWELYRIYRRERPDLILHYTIKPNIYGNLAARMAGIPSISTITGLGYTFLHASRFTTRAVQQLYRRALRWPRWVAFHNRDDEALFRSKRLVPPQRSLVIHGSGVNTNHFRPLPRPDSDSFIFLFIGRLLSDKGLPELVEAGKQLRRRYPQAELWVVGELSPGNPSAISKEQVLNWMEAGHIRYAGHSRDVRPFIKIADAMVLPSHREGIPRALLEGMAMGKPIITTNVPGCRDTVEEGRNGFLVPSRDTPALSRAMERMLALPEEEREDMGIHSRRKSREEFEDKIITQRYTALIETILAEKTKPVKTPAGLLTFQKK